MHSAHKATTHSIHHRSAALLTAALGLLLAGSVFAQQTAAPFTPIGDYELVIDGVTDKGAQIYHSQSRGTILIQSDELEHFVELHPRSKMFLTFREGEFVRNAQGNLGLHDGAKPLERGDFAINDSLPSFRHDGKFVRFENKKPWIGPATREQVEAHDGGYRARAATYQPQPLQLSELAGIQDKVEVQMFFGTWCPTCSRFMPGVLKIAKELEGTNVSFKFFGVSRKFDSDEVKASGITNLPGAVIYRNGEIVTRIEGFGWQFPALALNNALKGFKQSLGPRPPQ